MTTTPQSYEELVHLTASSVTQRHAEMAALRAAGHTNAFIGNKYGISGERVRQILLDVPYPPKPVREPKPQRPPVLCDICNNEFRGMPDAVLHLCHDHADLRTGLFRIIDDNYFERHTALVRNYSGLSNPPTYTGAWSKRPRRYVRIGSKIHIALLTAGLNEKPILHKLPPSISEQIHTDVQTLKVSGTSVLEYVAEKKSAKK